MHGTVFRERDVPYGIKCVRPCVSHSTHTTRVVGLVKVWCVVRFEIGLRLRIQSLLRRRPEEPMDSVIFMCYLYLHRF